MPQYLLCYHFFLNQRVFSYFGITFHFFNQLSLIILFHSKKRCLVGNFVVFWLSICYHIILHAKKACSKVFQLYILWQLFLTLNEILYIYLKIWPNYILAINQAVQYNCSHDISGNSEVSQTFLQNMITRHFSKRLDLKHVHESAKLDFSPNYVFLHMQTREYVVFWYYHDLVFLVIIDWV